MLVHRSPMAARPLALQRGVVLVIVLLVLVAMTMAGLALMRSVNTSTLVAGNLAFRQSATYSGDIGAEKAIFWLQQNSIQLDNSIEGYISNIQGPAVNGADAGRAWNAYWTTVLEPNPVARPVNAPTLSGSVWVLPPDDAGNTVSYVIHRLCKKANAPAFTDENPCIVSKTSNSSDGQSKSAGSGPPLNAVKQTYYRITSRIEGPRNTVSYVQTIVSM